MAAKFVFVWALWHVTGDRWEDTNLLSTFCHSSWLWNTEPYSEVRVKQQRTADWEISSSRCTRTWAQDRQSEARRREVTNARKASDSGKKVMVAGKFSGRACNFKSVGNFRLAEQDGTKSNLLGRKTTARSNPQPHVSSQSTSNPSLTHTPRTHRDATPECTTLYYWMQPRQQTTW